MEARMLTLNSACLDTETQSGCSESRVRSGNADASRALEDTMNTHCVDRHLYECRTLAGLTGRADAIGHADDDRCTGAVGTRPRFASNSMPYPPAPESLTCATLLRGSASRFIVSTPTTLRYRSSPTREPPMVNFCVLSDRAYGFETAYLCASGMKITCSSERTGLPAVHCLRPRVARLDGWRAAAGAAVPVEARESLRPRIGAENRLTRRSQFARNVADADRPRLHDLRVDAAQVQAPAFLRVDEFGRVDAEPLRKLSTPCVRLRRHLDNRRSERQPRAGGKILVGEIEIDIQLIAGERPSIVRLRDERNRPRIHDVDLHLGIGERSRLRLLRLLHVSPTRPAVTSSSASLSTSRAPTRGRLTMSRSAPSSFGDRSMWGSPAFSSSNVRCGALTGRRTARACTEIQSAALVRSACRESTPAACLRRGDNPPPAESRAPRFSNTSSDALMRVDRNVADGWPDGCASYASRSPCSRNTIIS